MGASSIGTNLSEANLNDVDLSEIDFSDVIFSGVDFTSIDLSKLDFRKANLGGANFNGVNLTGKNLSDADLRGANLVKANLCEANLNRANLEGSDLTGALLHRIMKYDWLIEGTKCDYIFCDKEGKIPFPQNRNFKTGEFEQLFQEMPTIQIVFESGVSPLDVFIMGQVVQAINERRPELELKLQSFDSRGQPHVNFTVLRHEYCE
ncbi:MAG: pentapeptide repeat-containing protein, partial [Deltaproteobacteria bacterium]